MDNPKEQSIKLIHQLTEGSPADQKDALETYFLPDAFFIHPLCRVPSFKNRRVPFLGVINSRWAIWMIYRWYKILSPRILLNVECSEFNEQASLLFVNIHQIFSIWFVPIYKSDVELTTKITLDRNKEDGKWYIKGQEDLYQLNELVKFFWPGGATIMYLFQLWVTFICSVGSLILWPQTLLEQWVYEKEKKIQASGLREVKHECI